MNIKDIVMNFFSRDDQIPPKEDTVEEKTIDFEDALPGVSNGRMYHYYIDGLNKAFGTNYVINKCINILAYNLSKLPLRFSKDGEMLPADTIVKGFDIRQPHPKLSLSRLLYECSIYYWYKGEFMSLIDDEVSLTLEPIDPKMMRIKTSEGRMITSWVFDNNRELINDNELVYVPMMNPDLNVSNNITVSDKSRSVSLVKVVKKEITNYAASREYNTQFFANFAQLGLTLTDVNAMATKADKEQMVEEIDNRMRRGNLWRTRMLPQGVDVADTKTLSMKEMEFAQTQKDIRDIILGVYGIPRSIFGITNEAGLAQSTVDVENRIMWTETIQPAAHMIQEAFNQVLMKQHFPGYKLVFDYSVVKVLQDNMAEKADLSLKFQSMGFNMHEINETLSLGMKDISEDTRMIERFYPNSLIPYSEVEIEEVNNSSKVINNSVDKSVDNLVVELEKNANKKRKTETKAFRLQKYRNKFNRTQRKTEKTMVAKLGLYFANQLGKVLRLVKDNKTIKGVNQTILLSDILNLLNQEKKALTSMMEPIFTDGALAGSKLAIDVMGDTAAPIANAKIVETLTNHISGINNYTYKLIKKQVAESVNAGETIAQLSKRITKVYKFNKSRSRTIARTESLKVLSQSSDAEYKKAGVTKKRWLGGHRDSHVENEGQGIVDYGFSYNGGLQYPGDSGPASEIINCTCALAPVIEG